MTLTNDISSPHCRNQERLYGVALHIVQSDYPEAVVMAVTDIFCPDHPIERLRGWRGTVTHSNRVPSQKNLRRLRANGATHVTITFSATLSNSADYPIDHLIIEQPVFDMREGETRDEHISRVLRVYNRRRELAPYAAKTKAAWDMVIQLASDMSSVVRVTDRRTGARSSPSAPTEQRGPTAVTRQATSLSTE